MQKFFFQSFVTVCISTLCVLSFSMVDSSQTGDEVKLILAADNGSLNSVAETIKKGANPNALIKINDNRELSPLMAASRSGHADVIKFLLKNGANVDLQNSDGTTALMIASSRGDLDTVKLLRDYGADISIRDKSGRTAAEKAAEMGQFQIVALLTQNQSLDRRLINATLIGAARQGSLSRLKEMIQMGADVNTIDENGEAALILASRFCGTEIAKVLVTAGADVNFKDKFVGNSPLHAAAESGCIPVMNYLLDSGANPNVQNGLGETPLMIAARTGNLEAVKLLLLKGSR